MRRRHQIPTLAGRLVQDIVAVPRKDRRMMLDQIAGQQRQQLRRGGCGFRQRSEHLAMPCLQQPAFHGKIGREILVNLHPLREPQRHEPHHQPKAAIVEGQIGRGVFRTGHARCLAGALGRR